jgi:murein DD-endopeptidase MepM/ murein hydrolase activator NlpD
MRYRTLPSPSASLPLRDVFGVRSARQLGGDLSHILRRLGRGFQVDPSSIGHLRPDLSLRAYARRIPADGRAPIMNLFDRVGGGRNFSQRVTKRTARDFRGGRLTYDEHDGVDFVCPVGTPIVAAAPGVVTLVRDRWLRGGLTVTVDHGGAVSTQYTHLSRVLVAIGTRVRRGEVIALSGASGIDLTLFFPWVPPHVHFMVWLEGRPVDPFLRADESRDTAAWTHRNAPAPEVGDASFPEPVVDAALAADIAATCTDRSIAEEIARVRHEPASLVALLEDSLHHDRFAWPGARSADGLRLGDRAPIPISMPLDPAYYRGAFMADRA